METLHVKLQRLSFRSPPHAAFQKVNHRQMGAVVLLPAPDSFWQGVWLQALETFRGGGGGEGEEKGAADFPTWHRFILPH